MVGHRTFCTFMGQLVVCAAALAPFVGCASAASAVNTTRATSAVKRAEQSGAGEAFPYEVTTAQAYLDKAREEASEAQYLDAVRLARTAQAHAEKAVELQRGRRQGAAK